jgi:hypothetical protein
VKKIYFYEVGDDSILTATKGGRFPSSIYWDGEGRQKCTQRIKRKNYNVRGCTMGSGRIMYKRE